MPANIETIKPDELPFFADLVALIESIIEGISPEDRATDDPDDTEPGAQFTIGLSDNLSDWGWQTGDNSYSGGAYRFPHWGVAYLHAGDNPREAAEEILEQALCSIAAY